MKTFVFILKTILYGWVGAAKEFFAIICKLYRRWRSREGKGRVVATSNCVPIYNPAFVKPDPLIYDQYYLTSLGLAVTWDNPDIQLYLNGAAVSSSLLAPGTTYEVVAQIWNNSTDSPAVAMPVSFSFLEFGISTVSVPIGSTQVNLGVKGGAGCPAYATMPWTTPTTPGPLLHSGSASALRRYQLSKQPWTGKYKRRNCHFSCRLYIPTSQRHASHPDLSL